VRRFNDGEAKPSKRSFLRLNEIVGARH
jgi:hypothetical protein